MSLEQKYSEFDELLDKKGELIEKEVIKAYSLALREIKELLARQYAKYGDDLSYAEMAKYNRLKSLEAQLQDILKELTGKNAKYLITELEDIYEIAYLSTGYTLETEAQAKLAYAMLPKEAVVAAVQNPISGLTLNERLEKNRTELIYKVKQELTQGLIKGEGYGKIAKRLQETFEGDAYKAIRVVQTESHRIKNEGRYNSSMHAQGKGLDMKKQWVSTLDSKTRDRHRRLDGQKVELDEPFKSEGATALYPGGFGRASQDINCRCSFMSVFDGLEPTTRAARGEDGKTQIIPYTTYDEWYEKRVKK
jgi:SPP1 gp7 family putative phage head morphogenesis protein